MPKKTLSEHLAGILTRLPTAPGVYQMKDKDGKVMYVGKAKNLKNRVKSYFERTTELSAAKKQMVAKIEDIELIICETEVEALVLETNIIKHLSPKYNILMKDDKNLAYIKITNSPVPELIKTRQKFRDGGEYYGPYVSAVEQSVRAIRRIFRIRNCKMKFARDRGEKILITDKAGRTIPCMDYYIGLCPAPCVLESGKMKEHDGNLARARSFLRGDSDELYRELEGEMIEKSRNLQFEDAQKIKETLEALKGLHERQKVRDILEGNVDVFVQYEKYDKTYIGITQIRNSQIIGVLRHEVILGADEKSDIMTQFLLRQYTTDGNNDDTPELLLCQNEIEDEALIEFLKSQKVTVEAPKIGPKNEIILFTLNQVREYAYKKELSSLENKTLTREHMVNVLERLGYPAPKKGEIIFECYDISHTDGHFTYASRVVIVNGKAETSRYKKYKIQSLKDGDIDDFASHREVMKRRTLEGLEMNNFPHLIIIDGGKGQLSSAIAGIDAGISNYKLGTINDKKVEDENGISHRSSLIDYRSIPLCSIAKREEEIFLPGHRDPILFEKGTGELMVLQKARDESHRFSIGANKSARMKSMKKNILEEIPGIGPVTRKKLLKIAGTIDEIRTIPLEVMETLCTQKQRDILRDHGIWGD
ncbi:MAG: excinuclease ABC subunit UvrC [Candidatus Gracilibacteria bacterium]|nr:excinuclease ABC subunit UvrC [Candidatus Gracilibacteria bacterium]